ncbi:MAG: DUF892 family protein [Armatimonadota bacterium]
MPLDRHLIVHLQEIYTTERDFRDYLAGRADAIRDQQLKAAIQQEIDDIGNEIGNLQQCLSIFGLSPSEDSSSPFVDAIKSSDRQAMQEIPNHTAGDMDAHLLLTDLSFGHMEVGMYQGMLSMAQALNQVEVADLLRENLEHEQRDVQEMEDMLAAIVSLSRQQAD